MLPAPHSDFPEDLTVGSNGRHNDRARIPISTTGSFSQMSCRPKRLFGPVSGFLASRIGCRWSRILIELADRLGSNSDFLRVVPQLADLVETNVAEHDGVLCHGSGLLQGQRLQAGWRKRLYVCPTTGRMLRIEPVAT